MRRLNLHVFNGTNSEQIISWIVSSLAFLFPIFVLTVNRADSAMLLVLGIVGIYVPVKYGISKLDFDKWEMVLILVFASWYAVAVICYLIGEKTGIGFKLIGRDLRLLFFIPAFVACRRYLVSYRPLLIGMVLAPFFILGMALWQFQLAHGNIRASGAVESIPFGDLSMAMGFMALATVVAIKRRRRVWQYIFVGGAMSAGIIASILSGTRGGWVALPILILIATTILSQRSGKRGLKIFVLCACFVVTALLLSPRAIIRDRIVAAIQNLQNYSEYIQLIETNDVVHEGCINDQLFIDLFSRKLRDINSHSNIRISVLNAGTELKKSDLNISCQTDKVVKVVNLDNKESSVFVIGRSVIKPAGTQTVSFVVRGQGTVSIIRGQNQEYKKFNYEKFEILNYTQIVKTLAWPVFWVPPNGEIEFVPIQNSTGEYIFPFANDSIGQRLEMWRAAWHIFKRHPLLGVGTGAFINQINERARMGDISPSVIGYDHPHNDLLNAMSGQGLVGLIMYCLALGYPLILFTQALRAKCGYRKAAGFAGVIMIIGLFIFGLSETMFTHSIVMSWYVIFIAMFSALVLKRDNEVDYVEA